MTTSILLTDLLSTHCKKRKKKEKKIADCSTKLLTEEKVDFPEVSFPTKATHNSEVLLYIRGVFTSHCSHAAISKTGPLSLS